MTIKAIETVYKGYKFRSRLEARWAVFFDTMSVEWQYEPEGFDIDGDWYLPDFWLPEQKWWIEIKPKVSDYDDTRMLELSKQPSTLIILQGDVWPDEYKMRIFQNGVRLHRFLPDSYSYTFAVQEPSGKFCIVAQDEIGYNCEIFRGLEDGNQPCWPARYNNYSLYRNDGRKDPLMLAYTLARQARFEHGQNGA